MRGARDLQLFTPARIGRLQLRNRFVRSAAYEGMCPEGDPSEALVSHHRAMAAGGVGLTTVAYATVGDLGRGYARQLRLHRPGTLPGLRRLTEAVHAQGAAAALQLAHAGSAADPMLAVSRPIGPSSVLNRFTWTYSRAMNEADISTAIEEFASAAAVAVQAGFDAVEIHAAHGYLLSQFMSPYTNRRRDRWGGSLEGRMRFPLAVLRRVRDVVGADFPVLVKVNVQDCFRGGLRVDEAVEMARRMEGEGADAIVLSGGFMTRTPMHVMRGRFPYADFRRLARGLVAKFGVLAVAPFLVPRAPFREAYFLEDARRVRDAVSLPLVLVGGLRTLSRMEQIVREGFDFVAMARPFISEPDLVRRFETGVAEVSRCEPCNRCLASVAGGEVRCLRFAETPGTART